MTNRKIDEVLQPGRRRGQSNLSRLLRHADDREAWTSQFRALLPQDMTRDIRLQCQVANLRDTVLTVHIANSAWATRLRFMVPDLLPKLRSLAAFARVQEIRIRTVPAEASPAARDSTERSTRKVDRRPPDSSVLTELASRTDYEGLADAILRLARHGETRPSAHAVESRGDASPEVDEAPRPTDHDDHGESNQSVEGRLRE